MGIMQPPAPEPPALPAPGGVTMFTTSWCGYCVRLKRQMTHAGIPFAEVNIEHAPQAADWVTGVNGGNRTVPTLLFPDGSSATNPSLAQVRTRLQASPGRGDP
jgi:mycoredoxin